MRTQRLFAYAVAVCLVLLGTGSAIADDEGGESNASLKGKYRFTLHKSCADVGAGFTDPPGFQAMGPGQKIDMFINGIATFDGNGRVKFKESGISILPGPYLPGDPTIFTFEETCKGPYKVKRDGSFSFALTCTDDPLSFKVNPVVMGQIGAGGSVLISNLSVPPRVETLEFFDDSGNQVGSTKRLCNQVGTYVRIEQQHE